MKKRFLVEGMSCSACSASVERAVSRLDGVTLSTVNLLSKTLICEFDEEKINEEKIISAVEKAGFSATLFEDAKSDETDKKSALPSERVRLIVSGIFLIILMYFSMGHMLSLPTPDFFHTERGALINALIQLSLTLPIMIVNRKFFIQGFSAIVRKAPNMDTLVAVGSLSGFLYGIFSIFMMLFGESGHSLYFESSAMILTLVTLGKFFEERAKSKTGDALESLKALQSDTSLVIRDGVEKLIPFEEIMVGDIVVLRAGERSSVDGVIVEGEGSFDLSSITGESLPVFKRKGDKITSASICLDALVYLRAVAVGGDTTLSEMIRLVESAGATKAPISRLADKVSRIFVPVVMSLSLITFIIWALTLRDLSTALTLSLSVLVISCPCALGLATPVAITVAIGRLAREGILVKDASFAECAASVKTVIFDKTGTVTEGKMVVSDVVSDNEDELLKIAKTLEKGSEHPIAKAIVSAFLDTPEINGTSVTVVSGKGVEGRVEGDVLLGGNKRFLDERGVDTSPLLSTLEKLESEGKTAVLFSKNEKIVGVIALRDKIKECAEDTVLALKKMGVHTVLLSGDNPRSTEIVANELSFDEYFGGVLPADKEACVKRYLEKGGVMMIGDGINDSPSLASATLGVAVGKGADIAIDAADVILLRDDITLASRMVHYSKSTIKIIKENLFWAFFYNVIGIPVAAGVLFLPFGITLSPSIAAAAMSLSSLFVVTNALRLRSK